MQLTKFHILVASKLAAEADVSVVFVASFSEEGSDRESLSFDAGRSSYSKIIYCITSLSIAQI